MKRLSVLVLVFFVAGLLVACGGGGAGGSPEAAAKAFMDAMFKPDTEAAAALVCQDNQDDLQQAVEALSALTSLDAKIDLSKLQYKANNVTADSAEVVITGSIKMSVLGTDQEQDIGETTLTMKKEGGSWKVCGGTGLW